MGMSSLMRGWCNLNFLLQILNWDQSCKIFQYVKQLSLFITRNMKQKEHWS